ncbi:MAG: DNA polymerase III subunit delta [Candidatus Sericytochromatia bacterium]|nr:DNA polymerase III subunit delta [Candidatus Sericytochromatia bacterium]
MAAPTAQVHLYHGADEFARVTACKQLEQAVLSADWRTFNLTQLGPDASAAQALSALQTPPFGLGGRVVLVQDAEYLVGKVEDPGVEALEALLLTRPLAVPAGNHLVFNSLRVDARLKLVKGLLAAGDVREFAEIKPWQVAERLGPWVQEQLRAQRRKMTPDAQAALLEATGGDRRRLGHELDKLVVAVDEGATITLDTVRRLVPHGDLQVFALTDALARRDLPGTLLALQRLLESDHPLKVLAAVTTIVRGWVRPKALQEQGQALAAIARATGARSEFKLRKDLEALRGWRSHQLREALERLHQVDLEIKRGAWPTDAHGLRLELLFVQMLRSEG